MNDFVTSQNETINNKDRQKSIDFILMLATVKNIFITFGADR